VKLSHILTRATLVAATTLGFASAVSAQEYTFRFQSSDVASDLQFQYQKGWAALVAERSGGQ